MKDPRIVKLIAALARRFPGTTMLTRPMADDPHSGEVAIDVLNAPVDPPWLVEGVAHRLIEEIWSGELDNVYVGAVSREQTAKYYAHLVPKPAARRSRRRRPATAAARPVRAPGKRRRARPVSKSA